MWLLLDLAKATHDAPDDAMDALYESADAGLLTLRACGTRDAPAWQVFLAGPVHGADLFPGLLRLMSERQLVQTSEMSDLTKKLNDKAVDHDDALDQLRAIMHAYSLDNPLTWAFVIGVIILIILARVLDWFRFFKNLFK